MRMAVSGLLVSALLCLSAVVRAAPVVYTLNTFQAGASTLDGSITVDDNGDGKVFASEITAWQFTATGAPAFSFSSGGTNTFECLGSNGCFSIVSGTLTFNFTSLTEDDPYFEAQSPSPFAYVYFVNDLKGAGVGWQAGPGSGQSEGDAVYTYDPALGNVIARNPAGTVPEPGTLALLGVGLAGLAASRRRKQ